MSKGILSWLHPKACYLMRTLFQEERFSHQNQAARLQQYQTFTEIFCGEIDQHFHLIQKLIQMILIFFVGMAFQTQNARTNGRKPGAQQLKGSVPVKLVPWHRYHRLLLMATMSNQWETFILPADSRKQAANDMTTTTIINYLIEQAMSRNDRRKEWEEFLHVYTGQKFVQTSVDCEATQEVLEGKVCPVFGAPFCDSEVAPFPPSKRLLYRQLTGSMLRYLVKSLIFFQQVFDSVFSLWL